MPDDLLHGPPKLDAGQAPGKPVGVTRPWQGNGIARGISGKPRLDRVSRRDARRYPPRVLEPEVMETEAEAVAYMDAAAEDHLARLDAGWAEHVLAAGARGPARVIDIGTGGGRIPMLLADRRPEWRIWAVDRSRAMLAQGRAEREQAAIQAHRRGRPFFLALGQAEARRLPFPDGAFDLVISNSLLHHLADPTGTLDEMARVAGPAGHVSVRDLRRPARRQFRAHVAWHGRHYAGAMRDLYQASVAAAFTPAEIAIILRHTALAGAAVGADGPYLHIQR